MKPTFSASSRTSSFRATAASCATRASSSRGGCEHQPDVPIMLQSTRVENQWQAREAGASFLLKGSSTLLQQLRRFMVEQLGFGDFVFRTADGREVARARDLRELEEHLVTV